MIYYSGRRDIRESLYLIMVLLKGELKMKIQIRFENDELLHFPEEVQRRLFKSIDIKDEELNSSFDWDSKDGKLSWNADSRVAGAIIEFVGASMPIAIMAYETMIKKLKEIKEKIRVEKEISGI
jgi:hypothetical protein